MTLQYFNHVKLLLIYINKTKYYTFYTLWNLYLNIDTVTFLYYKPCESMRAGYCHSIIFWFLHSNISTMWHYDNLTLSFSDTISVLVHNDTLTIWHQNTITQRQWNIAKWLYCKILELWHCNIETLQWNITETLKHLYIGIWLC